ncbi:hypothetical protein TSUD_356060 [Trifolium subterraneum]|uniref:Malectin-like domain-containing protein n=1 Tax=Trifolium subterraneum TaxID=3900 RepID=A0A2Z6N6D9_TRISU|nr:hypothetical protein TSUD_356060 [Trifolium subterraneum]
MMGMLRHFLSVLLGVLTFLVLIKAQDQSGFISIDCGLPENLNYSDKITTINYISDANFINTGLMKSPLNVSRYTFYEIIYTPSIDYIQPCLVNTGNGTPFISAIELRPLNNTIYVTDSAKSVLSLLTRLDIGSITNLQYRYKDDVYDRIWLPFQLIDTKPLNTSNGLLIQSIYSPPAIVMSTAATPVNVSAPIIFHWDADNVTDQYVIYMHFNEVEELTKSEARAFNITVNGLFFYGPMIPGYQVADTILSPTPLTGAERYIISLFKTENSTLPPILNAVEIYKLKDFSKSETA